MTASTNPTPPPLQCGECPRTFRSLKAIQDHCLATRHFADRYCSPCRRVFGSKTSLEQHSNMRHPPRSVAVSPATPPRAEASGSSRAPPPPGLRLSWRGNTYSTLSANEQAGVYQALVSACHAPGRLQRDKYPLRAQRGENAATPECRLGASKRRAVVIDCEMAGATGHQTELVLVCAIDFLTGEVLVNSLVAPARQIIDWRSRISGVTPRAMAAAQAAGQTLAGWPAARAELWRHIDADTVLVGQSLKFDLQVLRMAHARIVDSSLLTADAVFGEGQPVKRTWALHTLCNELLGLRIRADSKVHDCVEDVMAAREVVLSCLQRPDVLRSWADGTRQAFWERFAQRKDRKPGQNGTTPREGPAVTRAASNTSVDDVDSESGGEPLRWEDVVDREVWPKSPAYTDYEGYGPDGAGDDIWGFSDDGS